MSILLHSFVEGDGSGAHDEEDDCDSEHVVFRGDIALTCMHLWRHVSRSALVASGKTRVFMARGLDCEAEVDDFQLSVLIEHEIFGLEIAMGDAVAVHVEYSLEELLEVVAAGRLIECTSVGDVIEELTAIDFLLNDVGNRLVSLPSLLKLRFLSTSMVADHVFVLELLGVLELHFHILDCLSARAWISSIEHFDSDFLAIRCSGSVNLGGEAFAKLV